MAHQIVLLSDPRIASIPLRDNGEPLVDLAARGIRCLASSGRQPSRLVRVGVAERLARAAEGLPAGTTFLVSEGFRTAAHQQRIIDAYSATLRECWPSLDLGELDMLSSRYVAPLDVAPHVAGAALDLTLVGADGEPLDMGTAIDATPEQSDNACFFAAPNISRPAQAHRALLAEALSAAGFVNYPTEWWHWSYGDRYWAHNTGAPSAIYGPVVDDRAYDGLARVAGERV